MEKNSKVTTFKKREEQVSFVNNKKLPLNENFPFLKMEKDVNGFKFSIKHLKDYASDIKYTITIALSDKDSTDLYYYFVDNENLSRFFKLHSEGRIKGDIIEVDKFNPEILA